MPRSIWVIGITAVFVLITPLSAQTCASCHPKEAASYARTSMSRSFYKPARSSSVENFANAVYYHKPSDTHFAMAWRGERLFQRQYQIGFDGKETNVLEKQVDYVVGSGNHSRTYLNRNAANNLIELPLAWYSEKGGYWALNPGYDTPGHDGFRRRIGVDCMFCHNAYPSIEPGSGVHGDDVLFAAAMPEGIDCQRCHGPGEEHVSLARGRGATAEAIRAAIVNPARLTPERQLEVCMQCHLETTSFALPDSIVRYERAPFSYKPGEPLGDYKLFFDRADSQTNDTFVIAGAAYRMRKSECFLKSGDRLTCTTCHDPHGQRDYTAVCRDCHAARIDQLVSAGKHTAAANCVDCHMPKRRTEDAIHVVMTDHYIRRPQPGRDLVADIAETPHAYRGEVELYYPAPPPRAEDELYIGIAQVVQASNLTAGIPRLAAALAKYRPEEADYYGSLADAYRTNNQCDKALPMYDEALRRSPSFTSAMNREALCLDALGQHDRAIALLEREVTLTPGDAKTWTQLGLAQFAARKTLDAIAALEKATQLDPEQPEAWNDLGGIWLDSDPAKAEPALRNALRSEPNYAEAHNNLASLLSNAGHFNEARYHFEAALRYKPNYNFARFNYGIALMRVNRLGEAQTQFEAILENDPNTADAHEALGLVLAAKGDRDRAIAQYREALRIQPDLARANLSLGAALGESGDTAFALPFLRKASQSADRTIREQALALIRRYEAR